MTNFERITTSPEALATYLCWNEDLGEIEEYDGIENYENCFTVTVERRFPIPYDKQTDNPMKDILLWLNSKDDE